MSLSLGEIITRAKKAGSPREVVELFRKNDSPALKMLCQVAYNTQLRWIFPDTAPAYQASDDPDGYAVRNLMGEISGLRRFLITNPEYQAQSPGRSGLWVAKMEMSFIRLLEALPAVESEALINAIFYNTLGIKQVNGWTLKEVWPTYLPDDVLASEINDIDDRDYSSAPKQRVLDDYIPAPVVLLEEPSTPQVDFKEKMREFQDVFIPKKGRPIKITGSDLKRFGRFLMEDKVAKKVDFKDKMRVLELIQEALSTVG